MSQSLDLSLEYAIELHNLDTYLSFSQNRRLHFFDEEPESQIMEEGILMYDPILDGYMFIPEVIQESFERHLATLSMYISSSFILQHHNISRRTPPPSQSSLSRMLQEWNFTRPFPYESDAKDTSSQVEQVFYIFHGLVVAVCFSGWFEFRRQGYIRVQMQFRSGNGLPTIDSDYIAIKNNREGIIKVIENIYQRWRVDYSTLNHNDFEIQSLKIFYLQPQQMGQKRKRWSNTITETRKNFTVWPINGTFSKKVNECFLEALAIHWYLCDCCLDTNVQKIRSHHSPLRHQYLQNVRDYIECQINPQNEQHHKLHQRLLKDEALDFDDIFQLHEMFHVHIFLFNPEWELIIKFTSSFATSLRQLYLIYYHEDSHVDFVYCPLLQRLHKNSLVCPICTFRFVDEGLLHAHVARQSCLKCSYCEHYFSHPQTRIQHELSCPFQFISKTLRKNYFFPLTQSSEDLTPTMAKKQRIRKKLEKKNTMEYHLYVYDIESTSYDNRRNNVDTSVPLLQMNQAVMFAYMKISEENIKRQMTEILQQYKSGNNVEIQLSSLKQNIVQFEGELCIADFLFEIDNQINEEIERQIAKDQRPPKSENHVLKRIAKNKKYIFYAHNARRYDSHFILRQIILNGGYQDVQILRKNGILCLTYRHIVEFRDSLALIPGSLSNLCHDFKVPIKKGLFPYHFLDQVEKLEYEGPLPEKQYWKCTEEEYQSLCSEFSLGWNLKKYLSEYLLVDVVALGLLVHLFSQEFYDLFSHDVGLAIWPHFFLTLPSMANDIMYMYMDDDVDFSCLDGEKQVFISEAIRGGRTEVIEHFIDLQSSSRCLHQDETNHTPEEKEEKEEKTGFYLDFNSLYPSIMALEKFPFGTMTWTTDETSFPSVHQLLEDPDQWNNCFFMVDIDCNQVDTITQYIPILPCRRQLSWFGVTQAGSFRSNTPDISETRSTRLLFDLHPKRRSIYTGVELIYALQHGYTLKKIHRILQFDNQSSYLKSYIDKVMAIKTREDYNKTHHPELFSPSKRIIAKLMGNSVYGKFLQSNIHSSVHLVKSWQELQQIIIKNKSYPLPCHFSYLSNDVYSVELPPINTIPVERSSPIFIGALILAHAHVYLHKLIFRAMTLGCCVTYMDTDSIMGYGPYTAYHQLLQEYGGIQLGQVKDELTGKQMTRGVFAAPKSYILECISNDSYSYHTGFKGFSYQQNSSVLDFQHMSDIVQGKLPHLQLHRSQMSITKGHQVYWESFLCKVGFQYMKRIQKQCSHCHKIITYPFGEDNGEITTYEEIPSFRYRQCISVSDYLNLFVRK